MPETVNVNFAPEVIDEIEEFLHAHLEWYIREHKDLHENKIPKWRKLYDGVPAEENRSFPWPNASNVVVQVIGESVDNQVARVLGLVWATHPLWAFINYNKDSKDRKQREKRRRMLEDFMDIVGNQTQALDLYRVEGQWFTDTCKLGTGFVKAIQDEQKEAIAVGYEQTNKRTKAMEKVLYSGPRIEKLRHEDVLADPKADTIEKSRLVSHRRTLYKPDLEERGFFGLYDKKAVEQIIDHPDRPHPRESVRQEMADAGIQGAGLTDQGAEWDIYECHFPWLHNGKKYRLIFSYHMKSRTILRKIFNFMPNNRSAIIRSKLGYRQDGMYGKGYGFLLERYQEAATSTVNRRGDNETIANMRMLRVSPRARTLDSNFELFPGAILVGEADDIESIQLGDVYKSSFDNEQAIKSLVQTRTGITPAQSGFGTGGMQKRPAVYSSQGTMATIQENNSMTGHATSEFRYAHVMVGDTIASMYAHFGVNGAEKLFGENGKYLLDALKDYEENHLYIPIRATTASLNREVEKQNAVIMAQVQDKLFTAVTQMLQAIASPMIPDSAKKSMLSFVDARISLHQRIMRDFGYDQPDEYIPDVEQEQAAGGAGGPGKMAPGGSPMGSASGSPMAGGMDMGAGGGGSSVLAGPPSAPIPATR